MGTDASSDVLLDVRGLGKSFGATRALADVSIEIRSGTVHAFVGENGAGKSTLGKIIAGVFPPDQGDLVLRGEPVAFRSPREALERGIAIVAQEVALVPQLTVAQNVFLGAEPRRAGFIDRRALTQGFKQLATASGFDLDGQAIVGGLSVAEQQQVEILRSLARDAELIVLDEPTAALSAAESDRLHEIVRTLRAGGRTVILVSHFLAEVLELADTVTILRDGQVVRTGPTSEETEGRLVAAMLGRPLGQVYPPKRPPSADAPIALSIQGVHAPGVEDVSLEVRAGEIVVLAGLIGAGRSELARAVYGATTRTAGDVRHGPVTLVGTPEDSLRSGVAMIPESRKDDGLFLHRTIRENVGISSLARRARFGLVQRRRERTDVTASLEQVSGSRLLEAPAGTLSGGNQQKLLFARAMLIEPRVLIADEPTRGVDVGAKHDIYELIVRLAGDGMAVLLISNEIEEVLGLAHRVVVMRQGRIVAELIGDAMTEGAILEAAFGAASGTAA